MKYLVVLSMFLMAANALDKDFIEKFMQRTQKAGADCKESTKVPDSDIQLMLEKKLPATHEGKCMVYCMHKEFGVQNADGKLDKAGATKEMDKVKENGDMETYDKLKQVLNHCMGTVKDDADPCETAFQYQDCGFKKAQELGLDESVLGL